MKKKWQTVKRYVLCWQWGCEPVRDGSWWHSQSGGIVLVEPKPCARCGTMMGEPDDGEA